MLSVSNRKTASSDEDQNRETDDEAPHLQHVFRALLRKIAFVLQMGLHALVRGCRDACRQCLSDPGHPTNVNIASDHFQGRNSVQEDGGLLAPSD